MLTWEQNSSESERCKRHVCSRNYAGDDGVGISRSLLLIYTKLTATIAKLLPKQPQEEEESNGGTAIMEANIIVQERDHNDVFAERDNSSSIASGLSLLCFFSLQIVHLSPQFRSLSLFLSALFFVCREGALVFLQMKNKLSHGYSVSLRSMLTHHLNFLTF